MLTKPYPVIDGHRKHFVRTTMQNEDGFFYAADIYLPEKGESVGSYAKFNPVLHVLFASAKECKKACDVHNKQLGFTEKEVDEIITLSMGELITKEEEV